MNENPQNLRGAKQQRAQFVARTLVFLQNDRELLLLKGAPHKRLWANLYNGIGGHVEQGEAILDAALREILEETGLHQVTDLKLRAVISIDTGADPGILLFVFTGQAAEREVTGSSEGMPEWMDWKTLPPDVLVEDLPDLLPRILDKQQDGPPILAHYAYDHRGNLVTHFYE